MSLERKLDRLVERYERTRSLSTLLELLALQIALKRESNWREQGFTNLLHTLLEETESCSAVWSA